MDGQDTSGAQAALAEQIKTIRAKRAAIADAQAKRTQPTLEQQLADEQRALAEDELIDRFESEVGPQDTHIAVIRSDVGLVIVRRPHRAVFQRFQDTGTIKTKDLDALVKPSLLYPDKASFDAMVDQLPALLGRVANHCARLAGIRGEELAAK